MRIVIIGAGQAAAQAVATLSSEGFTGTLTVKMVKPTPLLKRIDYKAWLDSVDGRKIWVKATARDGDELLGEAEIVFISPRAPFWEDAGS